MNLHKLKEDRISDYLCSVLSYILTSHVVIFCTQFAFCQTVFNKRISYRILQNKLVVDLSVSLVVSVRLLHLLDAGK